MNNNSITLLKSQDLSNVLDLIGDAIQAMEKSGIHQWDEVYPNEFIIAKDIETKTMYGIHTDQILSGIIVLNNVESPLYESISWKYEDESPLVVHRLCVHPYFQNKGIAKKLMQFAEDFALRHHYKTIRLDAFVENPLAEKIYRKMNYEERGIMKARKGNFYCFEKEIKTPL